MWTQGRSERARESWPPPGFDPQTVQPVASRYASQYESVEADKTCGNIELKKRMWTDNGQNWMKSATSSFCCPRQQNVFGDQQLEEEVM